MGKSELLSEFNEGQMVSIYQKWAKEGTVVNRLQSKLLKLLKKLMLVLIGRWWPGLMNQVFLPMTRMAVCAYLGKHVAQWKH